MASAAQSANFAPLISRNLIGEKVRDALHLYVGRGRRYSVVHLSEGAGVPKRCIEAAMNEPDNPEYRPLTLENLASIAKFLRAPFASAFLEPAGLGAFELMEQEPLPKVLATADAQEAPEDERKRLIRRLAELEGVE